MMNQKWSIAKISFVVMLAAVVLFSLAMAALAVKITYDSYQEKVSNLENRYIEKNKTLVKKEVEKAANRINSLYDYAYLDAKINLTNRVDLVYAILKHECNRFATAKELVDHYRAELNLFKWDNDSGYFYIIDTNGTVFYHGINKSYEGQNAFKEAKNNQDFVRFLRETFKEKSNFGSYMWEKPYFSDGRVYTKYAFAKSLDSFGAYVVGGIYKDVLKKKVENYFFSVLEKERFGENNYGYFWIHDINGTMLMHPISKEILGIDLRDFKSLDGQYLFRNMNKIAKEQGGGFITYIWKRPNKNIKDEKISYVKYLKEWNFVIGSGFYMTELKEMMSHEKEQIRTRLIGNLIDTVLLISFLLVVTLLGAFFIYKRIQKVEERQKKDWNTLEQYKLLLDKSAVVSKTDLEGVINYVNREFTNVSGYATDDLIGVPHNIVRHPQTPKQQFKELWDTIQSGNIWQGVIKNRKKNGESYYVSSTIIPIKDDRGVIQEYISSARDVTELFENRSKLRNIFKTDTLTGLGSRVKLLEILSHNKEAVLVLINIDRFKEVNDVHGHEVGDQILKEFGSRLFDVFNDNKFLMFRVQADIFALYAPDYTEKEIAEKIKAFMRTKAAEIYALNGQNFLLTYTAGVAKGREDLLAYADMALNEAKNKKQKIKIFDADINNIEVFKDNIIWVEKIHKAIKEDRIEPFYQPIYNYKTRCIEKYECLMRMFDDGAVIPPVKYLPIAKKTKLYPELTYMMIEKAIEKFSHSTLEFSINLSIEDLMHDELMIFLYDRAAQKDIFERMVLEIVESEEMESSEEVGRILARFKQRGTKIAIDDFGSGYSNYDYLITLKADYIKIDGSIIKHLTDDERTKDIVRSIVNYADRYGMKTIAEFVSSEQIDAIVRELGVDYAQGYFYGKPDAKLIGE